MIEFYAFDTPNARKISIALEEMELPYVVRHVDIMRGDQKQTGFLRLNPNGKIPVIVDPQGPDGRAITIAESGAILLYLGQKTGRFWPSDQRRRMRVLQWLMFQMSGFGPIPGQLHHFLSLQNESDRAYGVSRFTAETRRLYSVMDTHLADLQFFGEEVSIADFAIAGWVWRHDRHRVDLKDFPAVERWYREMLSRSKTQKGLSVAL